MLRFACTQPEIKPLHNGIQTLFLYPPLVRLAQIGPQCKAMLDARKELNVISLPVLAHPVDGKSARLGVESVVDFGA